MPTSEKDSTAVSDNDMAEAVVNGLSREIEFEGRTYNARSFASDWIDSDRSAQIIAVAKSIAMGIPTACALEEYTPQPYTTIWPKHEPCDKFFALFTVKVQPSEPGFDETIHDKRIAICTQCGYSKMVKL